MGGNIINVNKKYLCLIRLKIVIFLVWGEFVLRGYCPKGLGHGFNYVYEYVYNYVYKYILANKTEHKLTFVF